MMQNLENKVTTEFYMAKQSNVQSPDLNQTEHVYQALIILKPKIPPQPAKSIPDGASQWSANVCIEQMAIDCTAAILNITEFIISSLKCLSTEGGAVWMWRATIPIPF